MDGCGISGGVVSASWGLARKKEKKKKPKKEGKRSTQIPEFEARSFFPPPPSFFKVKLCLQKNAEFCEEEEGDGGWRNIFLPISAHYVQNRCVRHLLQFFFFSNGSPQIGFFGVYTVFYFIFCEKKTYRGFFFRLFDSTTITVRMSSSEKTFGAQIVMRPSKKRSVTTCGDPHKRTWYLFLRKGNIKDRLHDDFLVTHLVTAKKPLTRQKTNDFFSNAG